MSIDLALFGATPDGPKPPAPKPRRSHRPKPGEPPRFVASAAKRDCVDCWKAQERADRAGEPLPFRRRTAVLMQTAEDDRHRCVPHAVDRGWAGRAAKRGRKTA